MLDFPKLDFFEQHQIVQRVEALFKVADAIEKRVAVGNGSPRKAYPIHSRQSISRRHRATGAE
jgi:hypothetical protein